MAEINPPLFLAQNSVYGADELGLPFRDLMGEGVLAAGDLKVSERGAGGPNMSVDIAAGAAWVKGDDDVLLQPTYRCRSDSVVNKLIATADATNPRKDIVIAEVLDATFSGAQYLWRLRVVTGTPAPSPAEPALPNNAIKLAVVDVPANDTAITNSQITDTRPRAIAAGGVALGGLVPIAEVELAAAAASIAFSSIPGDFAALLVSFSGRGDVAGVQGNLNARINGDTGANYYYEMMFASGTSVTASESLANTLIYAGDIPGSTAPAGANGGALLWLPDYAGTVLQKSGFVLNQSRTGSATTTIRMGLRGFHWASTAAINALSLFPSSGNFVTGSRATLYGMGQK